MQARIKPINAVIMVRRQNTKVLSTQKHVKAAVRFEAAIPNEF